MKIIFSGGGTLGPVTPLYATIAPLKKLDPTVEVLWIGGKNGVERAYIEKRGIRFRWILSGKLRRYFDLKNVLDFFLIIAGFFQSLFLIAEERPNVVVSAGGFMSVPLIWAARILNAPVIVHQQDVEIGLANKLSFPFAKVITSALPSRIKSKVVGNPVRSEILELLEPQRRAELRAEAISRWHLDERKPTILVLGGGTGSKDVNERIARLAPDLMDHANIIQVTGKGKMPETSGDIPGYVLVEFLDAELASAYAAADLAVTRAGFGTISELSVIGVPMVMLPLAGQQEANAKFLSEKDAGVLVELGTVDTVFAEIVIRLLNDRDRRLSMSRAAQELFPAGAAETLAHEIAAAAKRPVSVEPART